MCAPSRSHATRLRPRGVAIVTVLAILTVMALLAMCFTVLLVIEMEASRSSQGRVQSDMMAQSGFQHAMSLLRQDTIEQPGWDDLAAERNASTGDGGNRHWRVVRGQNGEALGRYSFEIEDELGKININAAAACSTNEQNQGVGTFELLLTDGHGRGLPISTDMARRSVLYRYGRDGKPGHAGVDDNLTESRYQCDEIDNNANGIVDEPGEGIDEPEEYSPATPRGDDRVFMSVSEMLDTCGSGTRMDDQSRIAIKRLATVDSHSRDMFWDDRIGKWQNRVNINVADKYQIMDVLARANTDGQFEPATRDMQQLGANILDYRDENHVLTTIGSEYGVEAVCFNEVLANDGSFTVRADNGVVNRFGTWYGAYAWRVTSANLGPGGSAVIDGVRVMRPSSAIVFLSDDPVDAVPSSYSDFKKARRDMHGWLPDMWKNATLVTADGTELPILGNTKSYLTAGLSKAEDMGLLLSGSNVRVTIRTRWVGCGGGLLCLYPHVTDCWIFPTAYREGYNPPKNLYYAAYVAEDNLPGTVTGSSTTPYKGFNAMLDVDGDPHKDSETRMLEVTSADFVDSTFQLPDHMTRAWLLRTPYLSGKPVRAKNGFIPITVTSCSGCGYDGGSGHVSELNAYRHKNIFQNAHFMRPDILELFNVSDKPISLRNWRVVINTGSYADQVGVIHSAAEYSTVFNAAYDNPSPVIEAHGYFYLTNYRTVFDLDYGVTPDGIWGSAPGERYPCYELFQTLWGVRYKVIKITNGNIIECENADWRPDQMKHEMTEWHLRSPRADQNAPFGLMSVIYGNTRNSLAMMPGVNIVSLKPGDDVLIVGLPREGGFVSFTLKNEYGQVAARTLEYGTVKESQLGYSTQKHDPTHYNWIASPNPSIGGTEEKARNKLDIKTSTAKPHIKNNDYASPAEMQNVRRAKDWENLGGRDMAVTRRALQALCPYVTVSGIRLDAAEEGAHHAGWKPAFGTVGLATHATLVAKDASWPPGLWRDQKLRMLSGPCAGKLYAVSNSTMDSLQLCGPSVDGVFMAAQPGDLFCVGPGYSTAMFHSRQDDDAGEWEWRHKDIVPGTYGLYLFGLNDSILTTEFLEENWNAEIEASIFNFKTQSYDPLPRDTSTGGSLHRVRSRNRRLRYGKGDSIFCGMIGPEHISPYHGIRLKLIPHSTGQKQCSGFAWFNFAYLSPGHSFGKININTAPAQVLSSLPGVPSALATSIANGIGDGARPRKPYRTIGDILDVKGMTPDIFSRICNLITTASDQYRIKVVGQALQPHNTATNRQRVIAESRLDVVLDRMNDSTLSKDKPAFTTLSTR